MEPLAGNQSAIGLDIASETARRDTAIAAARTGRVAITPPITLVQQEGSVRHGFLLMLPVYAEGAPVGTDDERWSATRGWAYAPLTISAVLEDGLDDRSHPYAIALSDSAEARDAGPFYASEDFEALAATPLSTQHILQIYGHDWRLQARARAVFSDKLGLVSPWLTATVTGFLGLLSVALWYLVAVSRERRQAAFLNHAQLKALVSGSAEAIIACDPGGRITLWNAAAERMLGYAAAETTGRSLRNVLIDEDDQPAVPAHAIDAPAAPCRLRCKDGRVMDAVSSVSVIRDADGTAQGLSLFLHDLSEHVRAEEQFRRVVEASPSAILMVDEAGRIQLVNAKAEELFGYTREELLGQSMHRLLPDEVQGHHAAYIKRYFASSEARPMGAGRDLHGLRRDGTRVPVEIGLNPINMADGRYALAFIIDITERKRHEESIMRLNAGLEQQVLERTQQIRTYSSRLGAILEHAGYAIIATDLDGRITLFNPAAEQMLGHAAADMTEREVSIDRLHDDAELWSRALALSALHDQHVAPAFAQIVAMSTRVGGDIAEWTYVRSNGTRLPVALNVSALRDEQGNASGFLVMASDLTEQKRRDSELHQAISAAEQANQSKSDFLANMSHEIRTPMNAILGMLYLLDRLELSAVAQDMTRKINLAARSLLSIINDVLDFSKIEAGRIDLEDAPFDLTEVLDNVAALMASAVDTRTVEMLVSPPPEGARHLRGDALRLGQVLVNLVSNAIKFTERGEVALTVERLPHPTGDAVRLRFSVVDTGIGIPLEKQTMIFSPFSQVDSSTTRRFGGTGLGLSICNRLVTLMGGVLQVESRPREGSHFHFDLTFPLAEARDEAVTSRDPWHVLIVDDHDMARDNLSMIVRSFGWTAREVDSGERAVAAVAQSDAADYDVVLMDWQMPGLDGLSAAADIRGRLGTSRQPIIIMVTAFERKLVDHDEHRDAVDAVLTKPITASVLYNAINEALARRNPGLRTHHAIASSERRLAGYRLLVVDDSEINREVAQRILEGEGAMVEQAEDGREAVEKLQGDPDRFDAVLMDMQMPHMDGYEATRRIRSSSALAGLPVIALTAGAFKSQQDAALAAGMNAFVAKPFEVPELIATIIRCTPGRYRRELDHALDNPPAAVTAGPVPETVDPHSLDVQRGLAYWREEPVYMRYLAQFARRYGGIVETLEAQMARHDIVPACADIHRMRGAAASLAMPNLTSITTLIEERLRQGGGLAELLPQLRLTLQKTLDDVADYLGQDETAEEEAAEVDVDAAGSLRTLLDALDSDDPARIERALDGLSTRLSRAARARLALLIEEFDYRVAETQVHALLEGLDTDTTRPDSGKRE